MSFKLKLYDTRQTGFFPLYVHTSELERNQGPENRPSGHKYHHLFLVNNGNGCIRLNGKCHELQKGDMFYLSQNLPHEYSGDENFTTSFITFSGDGINKIKEYYGVGDFYLSRQTTGSFKRHMYDLYEKMDYLYSVPKLCDRTFSTVIAFFDEACSKDFSPIEKVYKYIELNFSKELTLDEILEIYPYSKSKLCNEFKEKYGMSLFEAITKIRLSSANFFLQTNQSMKLSEIALSCGYNDVSYFCKKYKEYYGHSPKGTEY